MNRYSELINLAESRGCKCLENEPMSRHTSFRIGGPAQLFISVNDNHALVELVKYIHQNSIPYFVLGNGSNLLVSDAGIDGVVLNICTDNIEMLSSDTVRCDAGVKLSRLCNVAMENSLSGLEFAYGIPGSVGGAVFMNAGAYISEIKNVVVECEHITPEGKIEKIKGDRLGFGYRTSCYQKTDNLVISATFKLVLGEKSEINQMMQEFMNRRRDKQPLEFPSAGSVFKRPEGYYAGALIEECGLKGHCIGGACVSEKHAGFIVNTGGATCEDVLSLVKHIQNTVYSKKGVWLENEIKFIGR
ncbi:MAG: UDP-N-acetylmuramate dehydrogenase [bacterium]|nr:UDP-N-acetylmuramate dehydrogenase [bacterium]